MRFLLLLGLGLEELFLGRLVNFIKLVLRELSMDKKGDYKWSIVLSLILGLLVLGLSLFFIFNEFWSGDDTDRQICRQSIQVRAVLPEVEEGGITWTSFKDDFPLKCRTMVKVIEMEDVKDNNAKGAKEIIAETMAECWALYDKGDSKSFPSGVLKTSSCVPCARIHLTEEAKEYMQHENVKLNIRNSLDEKMRGQEYTYYNFLMNAGDKFSAFNFGNGLPFDLYGDSFDIVDAFLDWNTRTLTNKIYGSTYDARMSSVNISLPEFFEHTKGDLLINYGIVTVDEGDFGDYIPYLFYFQTNQESNPFDMVKEDFIEGIISPSASFCESWEGIPA